MVDNGKGWRRGMIQGKRMEELRERAEEWEETRVEESKVRRGRERRRRIVCVLCLVMADAPPTSSVASSMFFSFLFFISSRFFLVLFPFLPPFPISTVLFVFLFSHSPGFNKSLQNIQKSKKDSNGIRKNQ